MLSIPYNLIIDQYHEFLQMGQNESINIKQKSQKFSICLSLHELENKFFESVTFSKDVVHDGCKIFYNNGTRNINR